MTSRTTGAAAANIWQNEGGGRDYGNPS